MSRTPKNVTPDESPAPKRRGRPPKSAVAEAPVVSGEVIVPGEATQAELAVVVADKVATAQANKRLNAIAAQVNKEFGKGIDAQFAIGRLLAEARSLIPSDKLFGQWLQEQNLPFSRPTATRYIAAVEREDEVRAFIADRTNLTGRDIAVPTAVMYLTSGEEQAGRVPKESQRRVKELLQDVPEPVNGFLVWQAATEKLDLQTLTTEELGQFAGLLKSLVEGYQAERARRTA